MTPGNRLSEDQASAAADEPLGDEVRLAAAVASLRGHVDPRWVEVTDRVLARALTTTRRSLPVHAASSPKPEAAVGAVFVSEQVLTTHIRAAIADVPAAAPQQIQIRADTDHHCTGVVIDIMVQFDEPIIPIADEIRDRTTSLLRRLLGPVTPPVAVSAMHVHVSDVTTNDPHTGRPPGRGGPDPAQPRSPSRSATPTQPAPARRSRRRSASS